MKHAVPLSAALAALALAALALCTARAAAQASPADSARSAVSAAVDSSHAPTAAKPARRNQNLLTAADLASAHESTAYGAIQRPRPRWLSDRLASAQEANGQVRMPVQVYRNGQFQEGGLEAPRDIPADNLESAGWVPPMNARVRFGQGAASGAVVLADKH